MAFITTDSASHRDRPANSTAPRRGFAEILRSAVARSFHRASRRDHIEFLNAKSDAELAAMGLTRDRIVQHVFRDVIGV